ncbi:hypothetical protein RND81_09G051100 [Saponaria officinalis]|uniref:GRF-type domain-containing protein n=1 Tax=Saponaria officinalis TaxID=3572 RepID=A0AAW1II57_SAPOF
MSSSSYSSSNPICRHGIPSNLEAVKKGNVSHERNFFRCSLWKTTNDCEFFKWEKDMYDNLSQKVEELNQKSQVMAEEKKLLVIKIKSKKMKILKMKNEIK